MNNDLTTLPYIDRTNFIDPVNSWEISSTILSFNNSNAKDFDHYQAKQIQYVAHLLAPCIAHIFNVSISKAVFPQRMQIARVAVFLKKGDRNDMGYYRPLSILPTFSKVLEKVLIKQLSQFERKHNLLSECQFGFRKGFSTQHALLTQKEYILT